MSFEKKVSLSCDHSNFHHGRVCYYLIKRLIPSYFTLRWVLFLAVFFGYPLVLVLKSTFKMDFLAGFDLMLLLVGIIGMIVLFVYRLRRVTAAVQNAAFRQGETSIVLDEISMKITHPGLHQTIFWSHAEDVIDGADGLLVLSGPMDYHPIPRSSLPEAITQDELKEKIKRWIEQAKT